MTDSFRKVFSTTIFLLTINFLTAGCENRANSTNPMKPSNQIARHFEGTYCYRTSSHEYLTLESSNGKIRGKMYVSEEYFGEIFYAFEGEFISDSVAELRIKNDASSDPVIEKWQFVGQNEHIFVLENRARDENTPFILVNCDLLPDLTHHGSVQDSEENNAAEASENPMSICYHNYYPHNEERNRVSEFMRISFRTESVYGGAAGYSEGDGNWSMVFTGTAITENTFLITANYTDANGNVHLTSEQWQFDEDQTSLKILTIAPDDFRSSGEDFHKIECENIDNWAQKLILN